MEVKIDGGVLKKAILPLLSNSKTTINFMQKNNKLEIQTCDDSSVIIEKRIPIISGDNDNINISVVLKSAFKLVDRKQPVDLSLNGDIVYFQQSAFTFSGAVAPEEHMNLSMSNQAQQITYSASEIKGIIEASKALDAVARELSQSVSNITIWSNQAYIRYSNTALKLPVNLPNMAIMGGSLKRIHSILGMSSCNVGFYDEQTKQMKLVIDETSECYISTLEPNKQIVKGIEDIRANMKHVGNVSVVGHKQEIDIVCSSYKNLIVELTICEDGLRIYVDSSSSKFSIGAKGLSLMSIKMSVTQLLAISKLFGDSVNVEVLRGDNIICLTDKNTMRSLLIAGIVY